MKIKPKVFLRKVYPIPGRPDPKWRDVRAIPCLKQQKKAPCINFLSRRSQGGGQGYPDVWVPDVPGMSWPKTLSLGCFFKYYTPRRNYYINTSLRVICVMAGTSLHRFHVMTPQMICPRSVYVMTKTINFTPKIKRLSKCNLLTRSGLHENYVMCRNNSHSLRYFYAEDLICRANVRLQDINKQRERKKTKAKEGRQKKDEKTWKHEKAPPFWWGFSWLTLTIKLGKIEMLDQQLPTNWGLLHFYVFNVFEERGI